MSVPDENMQRAKVIHGRCPEDHERADHERAVYVGEGKPEIGLKTLLRLEVKLTHLPFLAPERVHHANRGQAFLGLREQGAILFLNRGRVPANAIGEKVNRSHDRRDDGQGKQRQLPVNPDHHDKSPDEGDDGTENICEAFVVDCLDRLRIVGNAKTRIARTTRVMILERERLQIRVEISAQLQQRLQTDFHENVIAGEVGQAPEKLNSDERQAEQGDEIGRRSKLGVGIPRQDVIDDDLERPGFEQVQRNAAERQDQADHRWAQERPIVLKHAAIDRHEKL